MDADLVTEPDAKVLLKGSSIIAAIKASGVEFILSVPDIVTSGGLLRPIARDPDFKLIRVCKEDECIGIASGLSYCDKRALTLIQHTGFLDSINAIRGVGGRIRHAGLHDGGACCSTTQFHAAQLAALRRAHRGADPRRDGNSASSDQRARPTSRKSGRRSTTPTRIAPGRAADRAEARRVMMKRDQCFRILARHVTDEIVVATYSSAVDWLESGSGRSTIFRSAPWGSIRRTRSAWRSAGPTGASSACRATAACLMNSACLVTIAAARAEEPRPLSSARTTPTRPTAAIRSRTPRWTSPAWRARPAIRTCTTSPSCANFEQQAAHVLKQDGPVFATLHIEPSKPLTYDYANLYDPARRQRAQGGVARL